MRIATPLALLATMLACAVFAAPAQAQRDRVFVASYGSDSNPCTFGSPCKTFQNAYNVVAVGGEVTAIDSAGFGPLNITTSVTITSPDGVEAGIAAGGAAAAIAITAGATDVVVLHGLTLDGAGTATYGIEFSSGGSLTVENCVVRNMVSDGLYVGAAATTPQSLAVSDSAFINSGAEGNGIYIQTFSSGTVTASIDRTEFSGNNVGLFVDGLSGTGPLNVAATDSVAANNLVGFAARSTTSASVTTLSLTHVLAEGNTDYGFATDGTSGITGANATMYLGQSTATGNGKAWSVGATGSIKTYVDNYLAAGNGTNTGTLTTVSHQ
jgi:hypothetical protein